MDLKGWRSSFTEDGVFNMIPTGDSYAGEKLDDVVTAPSCLALPRQPTGTRIAPARVARMCHMGCEARDSC